MEDLMQQNETTLSTTKKSFKLEEMRILAVLFLLLLTPAGPRPTATLNLRFKDIRVALARDPEGGPHKLLLRFTPEFTKTYLGERNSGYAAILVQAPRLANVSGKHSRSPKPCLIRPCSSAPTFSYWASFSVTELFVHQVHLRRIIFKALTYILLSESFPYH
ncbi:C2H2 finger domain-containing protein [Colletotrichum tamarilloi]|uniref:C2H2 finger domain-containing protein n=1 Tax=Colletotrichum tamarilloi TaxID=1209934 RepID=A0ABQ9QGB4_9PEZI|nr:C2H2 finger domain-containing protein [Colletotrichum tamarilloi]KAK1457517.1 C2H2 finger domain-containing protein [Colletotrichum tamarilloi]